MTRKNIIIFNISVLTIFFLSSCAPTATQPVEPPKPEPISMPSGWDDSIVDKIKAGESTKKVLAVLDFEGNDKLAGKVDGKAYQRVSKLIYELVDNKTFK